MIPKSTRPSHNLRSPSAVPILKLNSSICCHGSPVTVNQFRRQYHGCRRCYLVGSLINSIECGNANGSISLISRNTQSNLIETKCIKKFGITALLAAAGSNDVESMGRLLGMNANPEVFDTKGRTLIHVACANGCLDTVKEILSNQKLWHNKYGELSGSKLTAGKAKAGKNAKRVRPIMMRDKKDRTPLRWAMRGNHHHVVDHLLNVANPRAKLESDLMEWIDDNKEEMEKLKLKRRGTRSRRK